jgi:ribosome-associated protein
MVRITDTIGIPENEIVITASRSSGPGGQNVNKVATRVTLRFNIAETGRLSGGQKARIVKKLKNIISREGYIILHEETHRSQRANRKLVVEKFAGLMARAIAVPKKRILTKISRAGKERRVDEKKIHGRKKSKRRTIGQEE